MELKTIFERLGFGKNAHRVYGALLRSKKPLLIAEITLPSGVGRPEVYRNLKKLEQQQFVTKIPLGKRTAYKAENPRRIEAAFIKTQKEVEVLTEKLARKRVKELPEHIRYLEGFSGIRAVFDDVIAHTPKGNTFYRYTSERDLTAVNRYLSPKYRENRDRKKLERLVISNPRSGLQKRSRLERFIKYIPPSSDLFDQNIIQLVYGNRLAFINLNTEEAFIIEDKALASFQAVIFTQLYKKL